MSGTVFDLAGNVNEGTMGTNELQFESQRRSGLPQQNGTPEQDDYQQYSGQRGLFEMARDMDSPKERGYLDDATDFGKNILKAGLQGVYKFGRMLGPTSGPETWGKSEQDLQDEFAGGLDELIPSEEGGFVTKSLERGLKEAPSMLAFPGGSAAQTAIRTGLAGFLGEGAKELGAGEGAQTIAELSAYIGPDLAKRLLASGSNKEIIEYARKLGLKDAEITPLIQSDFKQKWLSKLAARRGKTQEALSNTREALGRTYGDLRSSEAAKTALSDTQSTDLVKSLQDKLFDMPDKVRETISADMRDLVSKPITGDSLINFWQDINANLSEGTKQLSNLKDPIRNALARLNPGLANDFEWANKLYGKYQTISSRLKPNLMTDIMGASQALKTLGGVTFGYYPILVEAAGEQAARTLSREMLLNPRFQNLSGKMVSAINQNKWQAVKKIRDSMIAEVKDVSPEIAKQLQAVDLDELEWLVIGQEE